MEVTKWLKPSGKRVTNLAITHISIVNSVNLYLIRIPILLNDQKT
jgi:hypothetical protein